MHWPRPRRDAGATIEVLVEVDVGAGRCGTLPGEPAAALAAHIAGKPGLRFRGIHAYQGGAQHLRTPAEREAAIRECGRPGEGDDRRARANADSPPRS